MLNEGMDIEAMLAEAAAAAEDTGEKTGTETIVKKQEPVPAKKEEVVVPKPAEPVVDNKKVEEEKAKSEAAEKAAEEKRKADEAKAAEEKRKADEAERVKKEEEERLARESAKNKAALAMASNRGLSENSISKILLMNATLGKFDEKQKAFVSGYFQLDDAKDISKVIFKALTASQRDLDALGKIVESKGLNPADRAFFLMDLDNMVIEDIYEQLDLLTGGLGEAGKVNEQNKLNVCRKIESVIASMEKDVFMYIERLQEFTNIALVD